jgi:excisionase family DNA binding protein
MQAPQQVMFIPMPVEDFWAKVEDIIKSQIESIKPKEQDKMLTCKEVMTLLNIGRTTVNRWTKTGTLQSHRIEGKLLYKQSEVNSAIKQLKRFN